MAVQAVAAGNFVQRSAYPGWTCLPQPSSSPLAPVGALFLADYHVTISDTLRDPRHWHNVPKL
jgi:hypothetical protein